MSNLPSKPFSNGSEYEWFCEQYCERCSSLKIWDDGFPALKEEGGCPIRDEIENARYDISRYPSEWIRELWSADDDHKIITWHYCIRFHNSDYEKVMIPYFKMMKKAVCKIAQEVN